MIDKYKEMDERFRNKFPQLYKDDFEALCDEGERSIRVDGNVLDFIHQELSNQKKEIINEMPNVLS